MPPDHYINLSSGIIWKQANPLIDFKYIRIQSCTCERKLWDKLIMELDYNFLLDLALGRTVHIYDASARKPVSRALYQGIPLIIYFCEMLWFGKSDSVFVKSINCRDYFHFPLKNIEAKTKAKLRYFEKFLNTDKLHYKTFCERFNLDGKYNAGFELEIEFEDDFPIERDFN